VDSETQGPRLIPITQALNRPSLIQGCEREWFLMSALISAILVFLALSVMAFLLGVILWLSTVAILRRMAKIDSALTKVYRRHIRYRPYYPARSHPDRNNL
jgi:type IV secretory pathway TrbD component